jgi:hypothetical protein
VDALQCIVPKKKEKNGTEKNSKKTRRLRGMMSHGSNGTYLSAHSAGSTTDSFPERGWFSWLYVVDKAHCLLHASDFIANFSTGSAA